jgi:hypothetical protein
VPQKPLHALELFTNVDRVQFFTRLCKWLLRADIMFCSFTNPLAICHQAFRLSSRPRVIDKDRTTGLSQKQGRFAPPVFSQGYCAAGRLELCIDPTRTSREDRYQFLRQLHRQTLWSANKQI